MNSTGKINELRTSLESLKKAGKTIGLVPTMGNLHDGHINLVKESLEKKVNLNKLNTQQIINFSLDKTTNKITEFTYQISNTQKIFLAGSDVSAEDAKVQAIFNACFN